MHWTWEPTLNATAKIARIGTSGGHNLKRVYCRNRKNVPCRKNDGMRIVGTLYIYIIRFLFKIKEQHHDYTRQNARNPPCLV